MKIVLATHGSRGDVQPMLALSLALGSAGHDVLLAGPPEKAQWAAALGCPYRAFGSNITEFIDRMETAHSPGSAIRFTRLVRKEIISQFQTFPEIIEGADLVIGASLAFGLATVAESMGIDYRYVAFTPQLLPSSHHPFMAFKHQRLPGWCNRATWRAIRVLDRFNLKGLINKKRRELGLKPIHDAWLHILGNDVIVASDEVVSKVPPDTEMHTTQTGYMHLQQPDFRLASLEVFLNKGMPPLYAGFGSMPKKDQARNVPLVVNAARSVGQRLIMAKFWRGNTPYDDAEDVFFIRHYPHLKLFPRVAAVIHHGGAGTTASCAVSGVPQIIVPHILDQYYWGDRVYRAKLGDRPIWRSKLRPKTLASSIDTCLSNDAIHAAVKKASKRIREGNSLANAVQTLTLAR